MNPKYPNGSIAMRTRIMRWSMMPPMTVSLMVVIPVVGLVLLPRRILFFLYFCRCECELAFAIEIFVTLVEIGLGGVG